MLLYSKNDMFRIFEIFMDLYFEHDTISADFKSNIHIFIHLFFKVETIYYLNRILFNIDKSLLIIQTSRLNYIIFLLLYFIVIYRLFCIRIVY